MSDAGDECDHDGNLPISHQLARCSKCNTIVVIPSDHQQISHDGIVSPRRKSPTFYGTLEYPNRGDFLGIKPAEKMSDVEVLVHIDGLRSRIIARSQLPKTTGKFEEGVITTHTTPTRRGCEPGPLDHPSLPRATPARDKQTDPNTGTEQQ